MEKKADEIRHMQNTMDNMKTDFQDKIEKMEVTMNSQDTKLTEISILVKQLHLRKHQSKQGRQVVRVRRVYNSFMDIRHANQLQEPLFGYAVLCHMMLDNSPREMERTPDDIRLMQCTMDNIKTEFQDKMEKVENILTLMKNTLDEERIRPAQEVVTQEKLGRQSIGPPSRDVNRR